VLSSTKEVLSSMYRLKPLAALAVAAALALAVPVASVSAARNAHVARTVAVRSVPRATLVPAVDGVGPGAPICGLLATQIALARASGNVILVNLLGFVFTFFGCGAVPA
jgi:hypothetical protein